MLKPKEFKEWIEQNTGHDVYYIDPFLDVSVSYKNLWVQGEQWHPGIINFLLLTIGEDATNNMVYHPDDFVTCNFFVGNNKFWAGYFDFVDHFVSMCKNDSRLNHLMFHREFPYNGKNVTYYSFVIERLLSLYFYYHREVNKKKFPIEHDCFKRKYGELHPQLVNIYKSRL